MVYTCIVQLRLDSRVNESVIKVRDVFGILCMSFDKQLHGNICVFLLFIFYVELPTVYISA